MIENTEKNKDKLLIELRGRLDTISAPELEQEIEQNITGVNEIILDFAKVDYISSAGLRVILNTQKVMSKRGKLIIKNVNDSVAEVFQITGFMDILCIE